MNKDFNEIDKLAKDAFENFEVDFNPEDWNKMEEKLNKKEHLMPYIWLYKGTEAFIFILIIFTVFNFWNTYNVTGSETQLNNEPSKKDNFSVNEYLIASRELRNTNNSGNNMSENSTKDIAEVNNSLALSHNHNDLNMYSNKISNRITDANTNIKSGNRDIEYDNNIVFANGQNNDYKKQSDNFHITENSEVNLRNFNSVTTEHKQIALFQKQSDFQLIKIEPIKLSNKKLNPGDGVEEGKEFGIKSNFKFPKLYRRQMRAAVFAGADINFNNSLGQGKIGFSLTGLIEQELSDRFSIRAGLQVSRKAFEHNFTREYSNPLNENSIYSSEVNQNTTVTMLSMPIHFNTVLYRDEKWRISLSAGLAAGMLTNRFVNGTQRTSIIQNSGSLTNISEINGNAYRNGLLQGGNAAQNFFMSASVGADVERQLGDRVTLFVQPLFCHNLNSLGPDKELYRQISLNAGIKAVIR
jgi:hypothetical protein